MTGATGTLAGAVARHLMANGANVAFLGRSREKTETAIAGLGERAGAFVCDVVDKATVDRTIDDIAAHFGRLDGLVNGAGGNMPGATIPPDKTIFDLNIDDYDRVMDLNLKGTLLPSIAAGRHFLAQGSGAIVNFSSVSSSQALTRVLGYSNAKAAVDNLTRWMATSFAHRCGDGIRVNAVCPGFFIGEQNRRLLANEDGSLTARGQQIVAKTPMGRFGEADEVCGAVHFLLSEAARFVTGQILHIDGGFTAFSGV